MGTVSEPTQDRAIYALAGFQAGMLGVLVMLAWLGLAAAWIQHSFWTTANAMAWMFYGQSALRPGLHFSTLAGLAIYLILYSLMGAAYASAVRERWSKLRIVAGGMALGLIWYFLWFQFLLERISPMVWLHSQDQAMMVGHVVYGAILGRFPVYVRRLRGETPAPVLLPEEPLPGPAEPAAAPSESQPE